eukprot:TRINITY_DN60414_c0_g1_i1.p1 TRINITY_DN60414_c0_g1~~TRINITY_DN60414_c0_g1_i1.p1  ORF type:complete len:445 (+),score=137.65 TRINITY_DN60414_c0_g1_i1:90-1424(+)
MAAAGRRASDPREASGDGGYDLAKFVDAVPDDLVCAVCRGAVSDPHVTEQCGHLFCRVCIFRSLKEHHRCPLCRADVHAEQVRRDLRAQRQIVRLRVRCMHCDEGCDWTGELSAAAAHCASCPHRPVACPYAQHGCQVVVTLTGAYEHEQQHMSAHLMLVNDALAANNRRVEELEQQQPVLMHTIGSLREELKAMRQQQRQRDTEAAQQRAAFDRELQRLRNEVLQLRLHAGRGNSSGSLSARAPSAPLLRWESSQAAGKFEISADGAKARHVSPGWATLQCAEGVSRGQHSWHFRIDPPSDGSVFNPSTVMIGVTASTFACSSHLGNIGRGSWCYQPNGFRWDGAECFAYGAPAGLSDEGANAAAGAQDASGDVISVVLDLDRGTLEFLKNGVSLGMAFDDVGGLLYPAVSLCTEGHSVTILSDPPQGSAVRVPRSGSAAGMC